jgi:hypothetical protein
MNMRIDRGQVVMEGWQVCIGLGYSERGNNSNTERMK